MIYGNATKNSLSDTLREFATGTGEQYGGHASPRSANEDMDTPPHLVVLTCLSDECQNA